MTSAKQQREWKVTGKERETLLPHRPVRSGNKLCLEVTCFHSAAIETNANEINQNC